MEVRAPKCECRSHYKKGCFFSHLILLLTALIGVEIGVTHTWVKCGECMCGEIFATLMPSVKRGTLPTLKNVKAEPITHTLCVGNSNAAYI